MAIAVDGTRHDTLNKAAFSLGQLVAAGLLPDLAVITSLADAARMSGLPDRDIVRIIPPAWQRVPATRARRTCYWRSRQPEASRMPGHAQAPPDPGGRGSTGPTYGDGPPVPRA